MTADLFFFYWISFSIMILLMCGMAFFWTRRKGYYNDQDRARYLAIWADVPEEDSQTSARETPKHGGERTGK